MPFFRDRENILGVRNDKISARYFIPKITKWKRDANTFAFCLIIREQVIKFICLID
jgi:hypothetical protein